MSTCDPTDLTILFCFDETGPGKQIKHSSTILQYLNTVSSRCARGKSSPFVKIDVHPKFFNGKKLLKNVTLQILNFILVS